MLEFRILRNLFLQTCLRKVGTAGTPVAGFMWIVILAIFGMILLVAVSFTLTKDEGWYTGR